ncbi:MAG: hypothetical protein DMG97_20090 [Acidobacteria bacterium]|nr:MAG: hypothetical protein DMG97_20090 [Acidobacteriota bacterium]
MSSRFGIIFHGPLFSTPQPIISNKHTHIIIDQGSTKSFNTTRRADQVLEVAAPYIRERTWHPSQSITDNRDGSIVGFGAESRVLKPAALQREIVTECGRISRTAK